MPRWTSHQNGTGVVVEVVGGLVGFGRPSLSRSRFCSVATDLMRAVALECRNIEAMPLDAVVNAPGVNRFTSTRRGRARKCPLYPP